MVLARASGGRGLAGLGLLWKLTSGVSLLLRAPLPLQRSFAFGGTRDLMISRATRYVFAVRGLSLQNRLSESYAWFRPLLYRLLRSTTM